MTNLSTQIQTSLMSFNIRYDNPNDKENSWDNRKWNLVKLLKHYQADFLGIQEGLYHQVKFIKDNTNYQFIGVARDDGQQAGEFSAVYYDNSKLELIEDKTFWLSETPDRVSRGWDAVLPRICTYGKFRNLKSQEDIYIFNTHFDHIGIKAREMSAKLILEKMKSFDFINAKMVLMGDFNTIPNSPPITILSQDLSESSQIAEQKPQNITGTFNNFNPNAILNLRIDYIFTHNLKVLSYQHLEDKRENNLWISDHLPILIKVK